MSGAPQRKTMTGGQIHSRRRCGSPHAAGMYSIVHPADWRTYWLGGQRQAVIAVPAETDGRFALSHSTIVPGGGALEHSHSRRGRGLLCHRRPPALHARRPDVVLEKDSFLHAEPGPKYSFEALEPTEVLILYAPAGLERFIAEAGSPIRRLPALDRRGGRTYWPRRRPTASTARPRERPRITAARRRGPSSRARCRPGRDPWLFPSCRSRARARPGRVERIGHQGHGPHEMSDYSFLAEASSRRHLISPRS